MDTFGARPNSMGMWSVSRIFPATPLVAANLLDWRVQEPDRLDSPLGWQRATDSRSNSFHHPSQRWISVFQCRELAAYTGAVDAHVLYT